MNSSYQIQTSYSENLVLKNEFDSALSYSRFRERNLQLLAQTVKQISCDCVKNKCDQISHDHMTQSWNNLTYPGKSSRPNCEIFLEIVIEEYASKHVFHLGINY